MITGLGLVFMLICLVNYIDGLNSWKGDGLGVLGFGLFMYGQLA